MRLFTFFLLISSATFSQNYIEDSYNRGQMLYDDFCVRCHLPDGAGEVGLIPPLASADFLQDIEATVHSIKYGLHGPITVNGVRLIILWLLWVWKIMKLRISRITS